MSEKHMPTMETVEAAWDAMGDGRFVAWLASHEAKIREQTLAPFVKMVDDMREAVASDVLIFGEGEYPVSYFADKLQECIDKTDAEVRAEERAKLQDRIEELEKNLSYEVEQKIKLADTLRDERAKRPDREQIDRIQFEIDNVHQIHGDTCLCGFTSSRSRSRTEHLTALFADAVLALEPEAREELKLSGILARAEEVRQDDGWGIGGAWGDYGEVVVPLRILSYVIEGELDQKVASTDPGFALTYAEQVRRAETAEEKLAEACEEPSGTGRLS